MVTFCIYLCVPFLTSSFPLPTVVDSPRTWSLAWGPLLAACLALSLPLHTPVSLGHLLVHPQMPLSSCVFTSQGTNSSHCLSNLISTPVLGLQSPQPGPTLGLPACPLHASGCSYLCAFIFHVKHPSLHSGMFAFLSFLHLIPKFINMFEGPAQGPPSPGWFFILQHSFRKCSCRACPHGTHSLAFASNSSPRRFPALCIPLAAQRGWSFGIQGGVGKVGYATHLGAPSPQSDGHRQPLPPRLSLFWASTGGHSPHLLKGTIFPLVFLCVVSPL